MKKRAFTLTELLIVVVIIGVLSAVVLPKFSKVVESRKTTEAEEMMAAVRNEQEARCSISKNYQTNLSKLASYKAGKNFTYSNSGGVGMTASAKSGKYTLKMPSYADGRICCDEAYCQNSLNKNYPTCNELKSSSTFVTANADCGAGWEEAGSRCTLQDYTRTCQQEGYGSNYTGSVSYTVNADCTGHERHNGCHCGLSGYTRTCQQEGYGSDYTGSVSYTVNAACAYVKNDSCHKVCNLTNYTRTCQQEGYGSNYTGSVTYTVNADCTGYNKTNTCTRVPTCSTAHREGETQQVSCDCNSYKTLTWHCGADTNYQWTSSTDASSCRSAQQEQANCVANKGTWNASSCECKAQEDKPAQCYWDLVEYETNIPAYEGFCDRNGYRSTNPPVNGDGCNTANKGEKWIACNEYDVGAGGWRADVDKFECQCNK